MGEFQSTPPTRGATGAREEVAGDVQVSIHAPHAGGDRSSPPTTYTR